MTYTALLNEQKVSFEIGETESILEAALRQGHNLHMVVVMVSVVHVSLKSQWVVFFMMA